MFPGFVDWVIGEGLGFAVMLPILLMANRAALLGLLGRLPLLRVVAAVGCALLLALAASNWAQSPFILVIVPLMVAASMAAPFELAVACGATGVALIGLDVTGAFGLEPSRGGYAYGLQLSVAVLAVLPFIAGLVMEQWRRDSRRIAESEQRFRRAMEDSAIGVAVVGLDGHIAETNRAFADATQRLVVLADHTKWNVTGLSSIAPLHDAETVVTDSAISPSALETLEQHVGQVLLADPSEPDLASVDLRRKI
jgi:PAS domain-containing protein